MLEFDPAPGEEHRQRAIRAARACPVQAIALGESLEEQNERTADHVLRQGHSSERIVIVGASLAGPRAAEALRNEGFAGHLTIVGAEPYPPYDRR